MEAKFDLHLACYLAKVFRFFIVTPRMFIFSLEYVENGKDLLLLKLHMHINIVSPF